MTKSSHKANDTRDHRTTEMVQDYMVRMFAELEKNDMCFSCAAADVALFGIVNSYMHAISENKDASLIGIMAMLTRQAHEILSGECEVMHSPASHQSPIKH